MTTPESDSESGPQSGPPFRFSHRSIHTVDADESTGHPPVGNPLRPDPKDQTQWFGPELNTPANLSDQSGPSHLSDPPHPTLTLSLIRRIAQGGSGEIWEAFQPQLQRNVAVKCLRQDTADSVSTPQVRQYHEMHFRQEALTAGYLEHPNILPVYDVAVSRDGRPMLIMKLVNGHQWNDLITADYNRLAPLDYLARHTEILATVANAVAYAHSRCVLHRDLKPSQVMIGGFDEVLLMDWGLAMAWEKERPCQCPTPGDRSDSTLYHPINPAGTPTFMAPEQTLPALDGLGPWTDIYLLGGILYLLLCGRTPHWASSQRGFSLAAEARTPILPPQTVSPSGREVPEPLANLAMACLNPDPNLRPRTAQEVRLGLIDWIASSSRRRECELLIASVRPTTLTTPANLSDQSGPSNLSYPPHPTPHPALLPNVPAPYASLSERIGALDRALALVPAHPEATSLRERLIHQYAQAAIAHNDLTLARVQATLLPQSDHRASLLAGIDAIQTEYDRQDQQYRAALTEATQARAHTERLRAHAEQTVQFLIHDLHAALKAIGRLDLLRTAAEQAMRHFDTAGEDHEPDEPTHRHNRAIAFMNIGEVLSDEGNKQDALTAFRRAATLLERLDSPTSAQHQYRWKIDLARAYDHLARQLYFHGQNAACRDLCAKAIPLVEELAAQAPPEELSDRRLAIATINTRMGFSYWRDRLLHDAFRHFRRAQAIAQDEAARHPASLPIQQALAQALIGIGNVHRDRAEMDQAIAINKRILNLQSRLSADHRDNIPLLEDVFWTRNNLGLMVQLAGRLEEAEALLTTDILEREAHSQAMPGSIVRLALRVFPISLLAETRYLLGRQVEAWQTYRIAYQIDRQVADMDPSPHYQASVASNAARLAEITLGLITLPTLAPQGRLPDDLGRDMPWPSLHQPAPAHPGAPSDGSIPKDPSKTPNKGPKHDATGLTNPSPPGTTVRAHTLQDVRNLAQEAGTAAATAHTRTPNNTFYCKAFARALLLHGRLQHHDGATHLAQEAWNQALHILEPIAPPQTDPATDELRTALQLCLGQTNHAQTTIPFLQQRRWISPLIQQLLGK
jgi:serine/threonine protein kinase